MSNDAHDVTPLETPPCPLLALAATLECRHVASIRRAPATRITVRIAVMPADLNGARVLLTGATGGIGNAIARGLHDHGAHVLATGRRREALDELAGSLGDRLEPLVADLADRAAVDDLVGRAGRVDVLVANA